MSYVDLGDMKLSYANDSNIPVVCFLHEPEGEGGMWTWTALNFMPRKERCGGGYHIGAKTKEEILEAVNKYVTPLYEVAATNLRNTGKNYYWELEESIKAKRSPLTYC